MSMIERLHNPNEPARDIQWMIIRLSQIGLGNVEIYPPPPISTATTLSNMIVYSSNANPRQLNGYDRITRELLFAFGPFFSDWELHDFIRLHNIAVH